MLVLATFISICIAAVLFLLRFLFALESELRSAPRAACVEHISAYRVPFGGGPRGRAPALTLVHSNTGLARRGSPEFQEALLPRKEKSQYKEA